MKDYFCKDCLENNNGWCKLHKEQGLKSITNCRDKRTEDKNITSESDTRGLEEAFRVIGKREMFNNIQRQMIAINNDKTLTDKDRFITLKQVMVSLEQMISVQEQLFEVDNYMSSEIDRDIRENSKKVSQHWLDAVGMYKKEGK